MKRNNGLGWILGLVVLVGLVWWATAHTPRSEQIIAPIQESEPSTPAPEINEAVIVIAPVEGTTINQSNILSLINQSRKEAGVQLVRVNSKLSKSALGKANDMARNNYFAHPDLEGNRLAYWLKKEGYRYNGAGEILAVSFDTVQGQHEGWLNSPTHASVLMNPIYSEVGIGIAEGDWKGESNVDFVVVHFGRPR